MQPKLKTSLLTFAALALLAVALALSPSCQALQNPATAERSKRVAAALLENAGAALGAFAVNTLSAVTAQQIGESRDKIDLAAAASQGAWSAAGSLISGESVERLINAWSDNKMPMLAKEARKQFADATNAGANPAETLEAIAGVISATALMK